MTDLVSLAIGLGLAYLVIRVVSKLKPPPLSSERAAQAADPDPEAFIAQIPSHAEVHIATTSRRFGVDLAYDEASLRQIDGIIDDAWGGEAPALSGVVVTTFGSYVGETIRTLLGGHWAYDETYGYHLAEVGGRDVKVFPFAKVEKRFVNGDEDSISFYYDAIRQALEQQA